MPLNLNDQQTYSKITVSSQPAGFERSYAEINPRFLNDWLQRFVDAIQLLYPHFQRPSLSLPLQFQTEWIDSDGPYGSSENYYQLEWNSILLSAGTENEICIGYEAGRQGGAEPIQLKATALRPGLISQIHRPDPRATFHLWHDSSRRHEFEALFKNAAGPASISPSSQWPDGESPGGGRPPESP